MADLYPEPPHLSAFVVPGFDQWEALALACDALGSEGCALTGDVLVAREQEWFRDVSDVEREVIRHRGSSHDLLARRDLLRIGFRHRALGGVALGFSSAAELGEPHPLEVTIHAGPLSLPVEIWSRTDRQGARRLMGRMERLLLALAEATRAHYGAIGVEAAFPSPAALPGIERSAWWPTTWFWSAQFGSRAAAEEHRLLSALNDRALSRVPAGTLFQAWRPWSEPRVDDAGMAQVVSFLGRVVQIGH